MRTSITLAMILTLLLVGIALVQGKPSAGADSRESAGWLALLFGLIDTDGNNLLDWEEFAASGSNEAESKGMIRIMDSNDDDMLSWEEFLKGMNEQNSIKNLDIMGIFSKLLKQVCLAIPALAMCNY